MWLCLRRIPVILYLTFNFIFNIETKDPELPLCPTNVQYFPQNLPMHCRLPGTIPPFPSPIYQNPVPGKQPLPMPIPLPSIPGPMPGPIPGAMPMPIMPMPQAPAHKLPVIVMPFYSPDTSAKSPHTLHQSRPPKRHRNRRPKYRSSDEDSADTDSSTDIDGSTDSSYERGLWRGARTGRRSSRHHKSKRKKHQQQQNQEILTPILQYVTKDGYVIYEKQISKGEAKDWLASKSEHKNTVEATTTKNEGDFEYEPRERSEDKHDTKLLMKNVERIEFKTELNPHQLHKKRNLKRKPVKKVDN